MNKFQDNQYNASSDEFSLRNSSIKQSNSNAQKVKEDFQSEDPDSLMGRAGFVQQNYVVVINGQAINRRMYTN